MWWLDLDLPIYSEPPTTYPRRSNMADIAQLSSALPTLSISRIEDSYDIGEKVSLVAVQSPQPSYRMSFRVLSEKVVLFFILSM